MARAFRASSCSRTRAALCTPHTGSAIKCSTCISERAARFDFLNEPWSGSGERCEPCQALPRVMSRSTFWKMRGLNQRKPRIFRSISSNDESGFRMLRCLGLVLVLGTRQKARGAFVVVILILVWTQVIPRVRGIDILAVFGVLMGRITGIQTKQLRPARRGRTN
jgi:hypothetical protein